MACLQNVVETARDRAADKGVEFHVQVSSGPVLVYSNAEDLQRIFSNLLENGVKYTPQGGRVQLQVDLNEKGMQARVDDTGIGIAEKEQARVFEGFYRTVAAKATGEIGTGLGLAIVKQLIERWRGTLELTSRRGKGSSFVVTLPAVRESEAK